MVAKTFDRKWWQDFFGAIPSETKEATIDLADTIGQSLGEVAQPTASAVSKPLFAVALVLTGAGVIAFIFRKEIKSMTGKA
ncbi:MAG: hypothetical protein WCH86_02355 [Kiritimatiellales bacterium]